LEAAFHFASAQHSPGTNPSRHALDFLLPKILKFEKVAQQLPRPLGDRDSVRLSYPLQSCSQVRSFADDGPLLSSARSNQIAYYHHSGGDTHTRLQRDGHLQLSDCSDHL